MNPLDVAFARSQFPAFEEPSMAGASFFENAGGSFACRHTIDALSTYYRATKVQPYAPFPPSIIAGEQMDTSYRRWAEALGATDHEVYLGPSTSQNTYVVAQALREVLQPGDEVIVTNQDHEANTGALRRAATEAGATLREWQVTSAGLLDAADAENLMSERTAVVAMPHASNIIGHENDVARVCRAAHAHGAITIVDGVSYAPHGFPDVTALGADIYLFSLYKTYSVHQGLMVVARDVNERLPNQGHYFNADQPHKRLTPAGPDHAQVASAGAVLTYIDELHSHHGGTATNLRDRCQVETERWQVHEARQVAHVLEAFEQSGVAVLGADPVPDGRYRCPTIAFRPPIDIAAAVAKLIDAGVWCAHSDFYAPRVLEALGVDPAQGVIRVSWVHYTSDDDIDRLTTAIAKAF